MPAYYAFSVSVHGASGVSGRGYWLLGVANVVWLLYILAHNLSIKGCGHALTCIVHF